MVESSVYIKCYTIRVMVIIILIVSIIITSVIKISLKIRRHLGMASRKSIGTSNSNSTP